MAELPEQSSQAFYRKYRPKAWDEVAGQDHVVQTLRHAVAANRVGHAYIFSGPRGTGKTTLARLFAKAVNCRNSDTKMRPCNECDNCRNINANRSVDLIEIDAASNNGVDDVRDLRERVGFSPSQGTYKVYIIDEVHMLSTPAFNALLKTLEEPPPHAIFVLATTEIHKVPATVLSRCQRYEFRRLPVAEIVTNLKQIAEAEHFSADEDALRMIARQATGSMRDAQSLLDQLSSSGEKITIALAQSALGTTTSGVVLDVLAALKATNAGEALTQLQRALDAGADPRTIARQLAEYLRGVLLHQMGNAAAVEAPDDTKARMAEDARAFSQPHVISMIRSFTEAAADSKGGWQPALPVELALAEAVQGAPASVTRSAAPSAATVSAAPATTSKPAPRAGPTATSPTAAASSQDATRKLLSAWPQITALVTGKAPGAEALLTTLAQRALRGNLLVLTYATESARARVDTAENRGAAEQAIHEVLGLDLKIQCVAAGGKSKVPDKISKDGMIAAALDHGAEIVDIKE